MVGACNYLWTLSWLHFDKDVHLPHSLFRQCDSVNYYSGFVLLLSGDSDDTFENTKTNNINLRSRYKLIYLTLRNVTIPAEY